MLVRDYFCVGIRKVMMKGNCEIVLSGHVLAYKVEGGFFVLFLFWKEKPF